jgi:hypothetical protein
MYRNFENEPNLLSGYGYQMQANRRYCEQESRSSNIEEDLGNKCDECKKEEKEKKREKEELREKEKEKERKMKMRSKESGTSREMGKGRNERDKYGSREKNNERDRESERDRYPVIDSYISRGSYRERDPYNERAIYGERGVYGGRNPYGEREINNEREYGNQRQTFDLPDRTTTPLDEARRKMRVSQVLDDSPPEKSSYINDPTAKQRLIAPKPPEWSSSSNQAEARFIPPRPPSARQFPSGYHAATRKIYGLTFEPEDLYSAEDAEEPAAEANTEGRDWTAEGYQDDDPEDEYYSGQM